MGVEVVGTDMSSVDVDTKTEVDTSVVHAKENGKFVDESEPNQTIKFGSHEEPTKGEVVSVDSNLPKDAVDEWPAVKQIHSFYFVRHRPYDDPKIKAKIDQADKEITKRNQARLQITDELRVKRSERAALKSQVRALISESQNYRAIMDEKKKTLGPLQQALGKLRNPNSSTRGGGGGGGLCTSEEELNDLIYSFQYRIQHESIPLTEEKQILREIKQLEGTRKQVIAHAAQRAKIEDSMGQKDAIQDQVKVMGVDLDGVRKEQLAVSSKITQLDEKVKAVERDIDALQEQLDIITQKRDEAFETIRSLRTQRDQGNALFYQSRALVTQAKDLAAKKDIKALEELSNAEVEKFISLWSSNKVFRDDYEKRILPSLDGRQLSRDGRIRNPDEKPILALEVPAEPESVAKANAKRFKEDAKPVPQKETLPIQKKETGKKDSAVAVEDATVDDKPASEVVKQQQNPLAEKVVDKEKLKELKREEEMAKAKQAMERKKKLAEKAAAKAAVKAQKEAEKKLKDREKKLKKKAAASAPADESEEPAEAIEEAAAEPESAEVKEKSPPVAMDKVIKKKEKSMKYRIRPKGGEPLPKAILRKRKSNSYLIWAGGAAAAALVLLLMVLAYLYMF